MENEKMILGVLVAILVTLVAIAWWTRRAYVVAHLAAKHASRKRVVLPMSTSTDLIRPLQSCQITARPQRQGIRPERLFIGQGSEDWIVNDIKICGKSQFVQSGDIPGDMFANRSIDGFVSFDVAPRGADVVVVATYIGKEPKGVAFHAAFIGAAIGRDVAEEFGDQGKMAAAPAAN